MTRNSPLSRFLPKDFDPGHPVAVIAGKDRYPVRTVEGLRQAGLEVRLIALKGETDTDLADSFPAGEKEWIGVGQLGRMLRALRQFGTRHALMVGQVTPRRLFSGALPDIRMVRLLAGLKQRNAETIFGGIAAAMREISVELLDARCFLDHEVAETGTMTPRAKDIDSDALAHGVHIAEELARLDIGQGAVVRRGTVLAAEAFEGTDEMIRRAGSFKTRDAIYVKTTKSGQDFRFDVPVIGLRTIESLQEAGIPFIAVKAGEVIILDKPRVIEAARKHRIGLLGF